MVFIGATNGGLDPGERDAVLGSDPKTSASWTRLTGAPAQTDTVLGSDPKTSDDWACLGTVARHVLVGRRGPRCARRP